MRSCLRVAVEYIPSIIRSSPFCLAEEVRMQGHLNSGGNILVQAGRLRRPHVVIHVCVNFACADAQAKFTQTCPKGRVAPTASEALYGKQKGGYMVVQPTVSSCTLVMEAKTTGEPPCREPYSIVYVVLEEVAVTICKTYF